MPDFANDFNKGSQQRGSGSADQAPQQGKQNSDQSPTPRIGDDFPSLAAVVTSAYSAAVDVRNYAALVVQVTADRAWRVEFQCSLDGSTWNEAGKTAGAAGSGRIVTQPTSLNQMRYRVLSTDGVAFASGSARSNREQRPQSWSSGSATSPPDEGGGDQGYLASIMARIGLVVGQTVASLLVTIRDRLLTTNAGTLGQKSVADLLVDAAAAPANSAGMLLASINTAIGAGNLTTLLTAIRDRIGAGDLTVILTAIRDRIGAGDLTVILTAVRDRIGAGDLTVLLTAIRDRIGAGDLTALLTTISTNVATTVTSLASIVTNTSNTAARLLDSAAVSAAERLKTIDTNTSNTATNTGTIITHVANTAARVLDSASVSAAERLKQVKEILDLTTDSTAFRSGANTLLSYLSSVGTNTSNTATNTTASAYSSANYSSTRTTPAWAATLVKMCRGGVADATADFQSVFYDGTNSAISRLTDIYTALIGTLYVKEPGTHWAKSHVPAGATLATVNNAAQAAGVKNVVTAIHGSIHAVTPASAAQGRLIYVRDGTSGAGPIIWAMPLVLPNTTYTIDRVNLTGLWIEGSAATQMTVEFDSAGNADSYERINASGTTTN